MDGSHSWDISLWTSSETIQFTSRDWLNGVPFSQLSLMVYRHRLRSSVSLPESLVETCHSVKVKSTEYNYNRL